MTVVEILSFPKITTYEEFLIEQLLQLFIVIDVDKNIARLAAEIRRNHKLTTVDSVIAATARILDSKVVTRDRAFKKVKGLKVLIP